MKYCVKRKKKLLSKFNIEEYNTKQTQCVQTIHLKPYHSVKNYFYLIKVFLSLVTDVFELIKQKIFVCLLTSVEFFSYFFLLKNILETKVFVK